MRPHIRWAGRPLPFLPHLLIATPTHPVPFGADNDSYLAAINRKRTKCIIAVLPLIVIMYTQKQQVRQDRVDSEVKW